MDRAENTALVIAGALMALFFAVLAYSATALDIDVPTCVTDVEPFREGKVIDKGNGRYEIHMVAKMWAFDPAEVRLPPGADVDLYLSAADVTHGLYIEHTNVNLMAVPGSVNAARFRLDEEGEYDVICHEYCGVAHHFMAGKIVVEEGASPVAPAVAAGAALTASGELFEEKGCGNCHSTDGSSSVGPTVKGLFGRETRFDDGTTRKVDEAYLREAIVEPGTHIVDGYDDTMPPAELTDDEADRLVDYIKGLS